jgi:glucokinase
MQNGEELVENVLLEPDFSSLDACLNSFVEGFSRVIKQLPANPSVISFAFPGPADYPNGIIGDLPNYPLFEGGVPLKAFLEYKFSLPTFINNNGDLFTYGEAKAGLLPKVNTLLMQAGSPRRYKNLLGIMLGDGAGGGLVVNGKMHIGDNAASTEIWCMRNKKIYDTIFEDSVNAEAVVRMYKELSREVGDFSQKDICNIALGQKQGNSLAAQQSFEELGEVLGDGIANLLCVVDAMVVIGGEVAEAYPLFLPRAVEEINGVLNCMDGTLVSHSELTAFDLTEEKSLNSFLLGSNRKIPVPQTELFVDYDPVKRIGVGISVLGFDKAVALGAYHYALTKLEELHL